MFIFSQLLKKMHEVHLPLYFLAVVGVVNCQYYFVTGPNVIRFEHDETVVVSAFGLNYARVKVWLQYKGKKFSEKEVVVRNEAEPQTTTVRVKESDIFGINVAEEKPRTLQIYSEYQGTPQFRDVVISYKSGFLIVQTDKPIYTPQQKVKIRTLALEESLKRSTKQEVAMEIISPTNLTMARQSIPESESGFFQLEFTLPPYPDLGTWTARAFYKGQFETSARSLFQVKEYVLPTFKVTIDVDVPYILQSTDIIRVAVRAKYVYGKPVEGKVRLQLNLKDKLGSTEHIFDINPAQLQNTGDIEGSVKEFSMETAKILNSPLLKGQAFPDGSRLEVIAWVFETATGKEEARSNDNAMFTNNPYRFHFSRSKVNFRPGWEYYLKVDVTFANGKPAENQDVYVHIINNGVIEQTQVKKTGRGGELVAIFETIRMDKMTFRASIGEGPLKMESEDFVITPYGGKNQIQVESRTVDEDIMTMRAITNMDLNGGYTGMMFMVATRGKVVYTLYEEPSNQKNVVLSEKLQEYITPSARLLVFYVDKSTGELVADSIRFDVERKCREKITLETINQLVTPGKNDQLTVKGSPFMWVGLSVMDKALLLENDNNVLKKNKMFEALASHDLGCGEGSGKSSGDVFKKSGLTVLTNAVVSNEDLKRDTDTCTSIKRTKRSADVLDDKDDFLLDLSRLAEHGVQPYQRSDFRDSWLFEVVQLDYAGENRQNIFYPDSITEWMFQAIGITEDNGMCIADPLDVKAYKDFFIQLDLPYKAVRLQPLGLKATIFNYGLPIDRNKIANVYIEGVEGLCFNNEPNKPSPKIQIDLKPNSAQTVSFPMIPLKAGVFPIKVSAIVVDDSIAIVDVVVKKLHVVNEGIQEKISIQVCLDPTEDDEECKNDLRVEKDVTTHGDVAERILIVDLTLPENSIAGTGVASGYIQRRGTRMDKIGRTFKLVDNVDTLIRPPSGNGEQMMMYLAPTVYALSYLQSTKQVDNDIEVKGNSWVKYGIIREISQYRHADGAYAAWRYRPASTWLTAFVAKVFCQANSVVDDAFDLGNDLTITLKWLADHVQSDGSFVDNMPVLHREMKGQMNERDPSLTSFVLVSLLECATRSPDVVRTIEKAVKYVENINRNMLRSNPYILAISTYALAMTESVKKWEFKTLLESQAHSDGREMYWGNANGVSASANAVETTAYALMAILKLRDFRSSEAIFRWLTSQRGDAGSFRTTQETVVTLQALSTYMKMTTSKDVDLFISLSGYDWGGGRFSITHETVDVLQIAENLPVERGDNRLTIKVKGSGYGTMMIDLRYNRPAMDDEICPFHITDIEASTAEDEYFDLNIAHIRNCDVCGKCDPPDNAEFYDAFDAFEKRERRVRMSKSKTCIRFSVKSKPDTTHGMSIVNVGLETDVEVVHEDLDKLLKDDSNIVRYELPSSGSGFIVFYLNQITPVETKFVFRLKDNYEGNIDTRQPSYIKVYDYYDQDQQCIKTYSSGSNRGPGLNFVCADGNREHCRCVQNLCAQPVNDEIERLVHNREQPALKLMTYTCNPEKADYAALVQIKELEYDVDTKEVIARGIVIASIHTGIRDLIRDEEMAFFWKFHCSQVELVRGKKYYIIGKDGYMFNTGTNQEYRYPLMGTTLIIENKNDNGLVDRVMRVYETIMATRGCSHR